MEPNGEFHLVSSLHPNSENWTLSCQLLHNGNVNFYNNNNGFGSVKKIILVDEEVWF